MASAIPSVSILFHGNCIDGWFSAYISQTFYSSLGVAVKMYPISPNQANTWPHIDKIKGTNVLLADVSIPADKRSEWATAGVLGFDVIDHHASAKVHWPELNALGLPTIDTTRCAALQAWHKFYPLQAVPFWLLQIDRIDRWDNPTFEDRCLREILSVIAHKPVEKKMDEAIALTQSFLISCNNPAELLSLLEQGKALLEKKDTELMALLQQKGKTVVVGQEHIAAWQLPAHWLNAQLFIVDNTNITLDSTEAAHIVFHYMPHINAFINYRKKTLYGRGPSAVEKTMYVYSARARGFDITNGTVFKGHPTSAGASLIVGDAPLIPFLLAAA